MFNPYDVLGVPRNATQEQIKKAYREKTRQWHPDRHKGDSKAEERFKEINKAYEQLKGVRTQRADSFSGGFSENMRWWEDVAKRWQKEEWRDYYDPVKDFEEAMRKAYANQKTDDYYDFVTGTYKKYRKTRKTCEYCNGKGYTES